MSDDDRVDLTPWTAPPPPSDLADRVAAALAAPVVSAASEPPPGRPRWWMFAAAGGLVALAAGVAIVAWPREGATRDRGEVVATAATTIELSDELEAMAEAGASLAWRTDARGVHVTHRAGNVTYRQRSARALDVSITGPRDVAGPAAVVLASTRATFRVEVPMNRALIVGGSAAAVAAIAVLVVYDGQVDAKQPDRPTRTVAAGERVELTTAPPTTPAPPPVTVAARDRVRRDAIAAAMQARRPGGVPNPSGAPSTGGGMVGSAPAPVITLDKEAIRAGVKDVVPMLSECYEAELERDPAIGETTVKTHFAIDSDPELGTIVTLHDLEVTGPLVQSTDFRDCMAATIEAVVLPPLGDGGHVDVNYPFVFRPTSDQDDDEGPVTTRTTTPPTTPTRPTPPAGAAQLAEDASIAARNGEYGRAMALSERALALPPDGVAHTKAINVAALSACQLKNLAKVRRYYALAKPSAKIGIRQTCLRAAQFDPGAP